MQVDKPFIPRNQRNKFRMERSSRFISFSGWGGIIAGCTALAGAWLVYPYVYGDKEERINPDLAYNVSGPFTEITNSRIVWIGLGTFLLAIGLSFIVTYLKSRKQGVPIWGPYERRLIEAMAVPIAAGAIFTAQLLLYGNPALIAPACLVFYGLALLHASTYSRYEIRYLAYFMLLLGMVNLRFAGHGLIFWAIGFGLGHMVYGWVTGWKKRT